MAQAGDRDTIIFKERISSPGEPVGAGSSSGSPD
jgi:hypothetical protein